MEWIGFLVCCAIAGALLLSGVVLSWAAVIGLSQQRSDLSAGIAMLAIGAAVAWACVQMAPFEIVLRG